MIKFLKGPMEALEGIEIFPIISFLIFFSFFIGVLIMVIRKDKRSIEEASALPLDQDDQQSVNPAP